MRWILVWAELWYVPFISTCVALWLEGKLSSRNHEVMQRLWRLVYMQCISVHWLNKVPAGKSHIDSLCQDLPAIQIVGTTEEHTESSYEYLGMKMQRAQIAADMQAGWFASHSSSKQALKDPGSENALWGTILPGRQTGAELGSMIWSPGASMGTEILLHNPEMEVSTPHKSCHTPQLYRFHFSLMPIMILGHKWLPGITSLGY